MRCVNRRNGHGFFLSRAAREALLGYAWPGVRYAADSPPSTRNVDAVT